MDATLQHLNRFSTPAKALAEPAPDASQLKQILEVARSRRITDACARTAS